MINFGWIFFDTIFLKNNIKYYFFAKKRKNALSIEASEGPATEVENPYFDLMLLFSKIEPLWVAVVVAVVAKKV